MLKPQQKQDLQRKLKEEAARAVVRDAIARGYRCIELGHDGRRPIFFCVYCGTRCYTDVALWDHLRGNVHARRVSSSPAAAAAADSAGSCCDVKDSAMVVDVKVKTKPPSSFKLPLLVLPPPQLEFKLVDQGHIFVKVRPCSKLVEACWFEKRPLLAPSQHHFQQQQNEVVYAIVVFPYSEGLGRARNWKNEKSSAESSMEIVEHTGGVKRGRRRAKTVDRICFICRQKMVPGKDVATLLNVNNGHSMMMCHSRNMRGAFHVYHICCLINWILIFNAKQWMGQSLTFRRHFRNSLKTESGEVSATEVQSNACKAIFCPECQGTGVRLPGGQLERPRYRLAQIFEWVLQLVQARKVWTDHLGQETTGLLFHASKGINHPKDFESSLVFPRAVLRLYSTADLVVDSGSSSKMETDNSTSEMEIDD